MGGMMGVPAPKVALDTLRDRIAEGIAANVKAYNVPAVCVRVGIQEGVEPGDADEAFRSRRVYVKNRLVQLEKPALLTIAAAVLKEFDIPNLAEIVSELTVHATHRITEVTRRDALKVLNRLDTLFNDVDLFEGLNIVSSEHLSHDGIDNHLNFLPSLAKDIVQHYVRNPDYSTEELLIRCGTLTCSQTNFFALLEKLLHPVVRRGDEQNELATQLNAVLRPDGFQAVVVGEQSTHPIYAVQRLGTGVAGAVKNLIFASVGPKPELVLRDAVSNDIEITKHADMCLVFDRPLPASGLAWVNMAEWWQERQGLAELKSARQSLGERLKRSVELSHSPGEYAIFRTYHEVFGPKLGDRLPALIPQVYLHYDPFTQAERVQLGKDSVLARQRMDFLMLLDGRVRIVIEVDGQQHYAEGGRASPAHYAKMVEEDRRLRLQGYELYRFGGAEFPDADKSNDRYVVGPQAKKVVIDFFERLFDRHKVKP
ncbi:hypothetical protein GN109_12650 [Collimonas pratensis]|uniref:AbiJ-related protein n=1 Tax=Collimonas pratensis TaxID=279113 RepID=UPI00143DFC6F|nr:hypothetical protein [Collimonas pratensis]NKI70269.1 hypothetical protein [Collimonas pratensis]